MLESILIHMITPYLVHPGFPDGEEVYKSGLTGSSYQTDKPATDYPMLTVDVMTRDNSFNLLKPGIYATFPVFEERKLYILRGNKVVAKAPIIQVIELNEKQNTSVGSANVAFTKADKVIIVYKKDNIEIHCFLYISDEMLDY